MSSSSFVLGLLGGRSFLVATWVPPVFTVDSLFFCAQRPACGAPTYCFCSLLLLLLLRVFFSMSFRHVAAAFCALFQGVSSRLLAFCHGRHFFVHFHNMLHNNNHLQAGVSYCLKASFFFMVLRFAGLSMLNAWCLFRPSFLQTDGFTRVFAFFCVCVRAVDVSNE